MFASQPDSKRSVTPKLACAVCSALLLAACGSGDGAGSPSEIGPSATFTGIGSLPGDASSQAIAVSADGVVVVGSSKAASGKSQAFRWSALEGMSGLGFMAGGTTSIALAVSADGSVVVGNGDAMSAGSAVFRWSASTGLVHLNPLATSNLCAAGGVSGDGSVVVGTCLTTGSSAFRWTESTGMVSLGQFGTGSNRTSNACAITADGAVIVGIGHPVLTGAVVWTSAGDSRILGKVSGDISAGAFAVSRDGRVIVGSSTEPSVHQRAFRWTSEAGMTAIASSTASLSDSIALAVSGDGQVIVGWGTTPAGEAALIWDEQHGLRQLQAVLEMDYRTTISGWKLSRATGISDDGRIIVGFGTNPSGQSEGWVLKLPN